MIKQNILKELLNKVEIEIKKHTQIYETTKYLVQNGDLKSDGKYDTRATEANYLADGQKQRLTELEQELELLTGINIKKSNKEVSIGSLITLEINNLSKRYFVAPTAGGTMLKMDDEVILVISVFSPIGDAAIGLSKGESFEIELNGSSKVYKILNIE